MFHLLPRQLWAKLPQASNAGLQPGRNAGSTGTQSQAGSTSSQVSSVTSPKVCSTLPQASRVTSPQAGISSTPWSFQEFCPLKRRVYTGRSQA